MEITINMDNLDIAIFPIREESQVKAYVRVTIDDFIDLKEMKIIETRDGNLFLKAPDRIYNNSKGERIKSSYFFLRTREIKNLIEDAVLEKYRAEFL